MGKKKSLTKKQLAVIEDLFAGELDEQAVLSKHNVNRNLYNKWLADELFAEQFNEHIARAYRQSQFILARYAPLAAAKLVQLTESESQETARKACLDIISMSSREDKNPQINLGAKYLAPQFTAGSSMDSESPLGLSAETASRILAALAEDANQ